MESKNKCIFKKKMESKNKCSQKISADLRIFRNFFPSSFFKGGMNDIRRTQILYQKTDFNHHKICQLNGIFKCIKCKKNNSSMVIKPNVQLCLFCGTPNMVK